MVAFRLVHLPPVLFWSEFCLPPSPFYFMAEGCLLLLSTSQYQTDRFFIVTGGIKADTGSFSRLSFAVVIHNYLLKSISITYCTMFFKKSKVF